MLLKDIHLHTHHQGRALVVRVFGEPVYLNNVVSLVNVVEDEAGDVEKVQLFFSSILPPQAMLAKGTVIAVKEPYYELCDGSSYLRVDHPSNVKILRQEDPWLLEFSKAPSKPMPWSHLPDTTTTNLVSWTPKPCTELVDLLIISANFWLPKSYINACSRSLHRTRMGSES